jgi:hypothetical protein
MVRHHIKKKKKVDATNRSGNVAAAASSSSSSSVGTSGTKNRRGVEEELVDLDRFAGSSDEGEGGDGADEDDDTDVGGGGDGDDDAEKDDDEDDDGEGSDSAGDSEDDYDDAFAGQPKIIAKTSKKKRRGKEEVVRRRRADVDGGDGKGRDVDEGGKDGDGDDDYDDDYGATTTSGGRGARQSKSIGMADAMSRILGMAAGGRSSSTSRPPSSADDANKRGKTTASKSTANIINNDRPVILSKTTTPLQRLQQKVRMEERALVQKRRNRRAENLVAMRLPLAPTAEMSAERLWKQKKATREKAAGKRRREGDVDGDDSAGKEGDDEDAINAMAIAGEIESERAHRRIATRGVVALFNAISKHRSAVAAEAAEKEEDRRRIREEGRLRGLAARNARRNNEVGGGGADNDAANAKTKHGFLDMIKMSAAAGSTTAGVGGERERGGAGVGDVRDASSSTGGRGGKTAGGKSIGWSALKDDFMMNSKLKVRFILEMFRCAIFLRFAR